MFVLFVLTISALPPAHKENGPLVQPTNWNCWGEGSDWSGLWSLGCLTEKPAHTAHVRPADGLAPIRSAATVDGLAPISMPFSETVSAASGCKSGSASSNRFSALADGATIAEPPPWSKDAGTLVPIEEFIRDPSKRQTGRIKEHTKKISVKFAGCQSGCRCTSEHREDLPELPSPGLEPSANGGQATERSGSAFVNSQSERYNAFEKTSIGKGQATERSGSAFVKIRHGR